MTDESGTEIGKYRLVSKLGEGGMGTVYLAEHALMGKRVALKVIRAEVAGNLDLTSRFINEARAAARIPHPAIVQMFDCDRDSLGRAYLAMELLRGESLGAFLRRQRSLRAYPALLRRIARDTALAVGAAHAAGIVHRDLKPDNLFLAAHHQGPSFVEVKVLDFGVAKLAAAISGPDAHSTQSGALIGTVVYMSPEQCLGSKQIDGRSDIYALGCILFEMAAGQTPFSDLGVGPTIAAHLTQTPPRLQDVAPGVDPALDALVARMLAKSPDERPATMEAVAAALAEGLPADARGGPIALPAGVMVFGGEPGQPRTPTARTVGLDPTMALALPSPEPSQPRTTLSSSASAVDRAPAAGKRSRSGAVFAVAAGVALVAGALAIWRPGPLARQTPALPVVEPAVETVSIEVTGIPPAGRALVDGRAVALPLRMSRGSSEHELRVEAPGFEPFVDRIRAERDLRVAVTLKPIAPAPVPAPEAAVQPVSQPARPVEKPRRPKAKNVVPKAEPERGEGARRAKDLIQDI